MRNPDRTRRRSQASIERLPLREQLGDQGGSQSGRRPWRYQGLRGEQQLPALVEEPEPRVYSIATAYGQRLAGDHDRAPEWLEKSERRWRMDLGGPKV